MCGKVGYRIVVVRKMSIKKICLVSIRSHEKLARKVYECVCMAAPTARPYIINIKYSVI